MLHLEQLHADAGKHELKERRDDQDVSDGADGYEHTLHHVLWAQEHTHTHTEVSQQTFQLITTDEWLVSEERL